MQKADPINPQRLFWELNDYLPDDAILSADSGSAANWFARDLKIRAGMMASLSGTLATMGAGVPYAIGAKFAHPDRPVIALVGDGAMQMNGINELITIEQAKEMTHALVKGDVHAGRIIRQTVRDKVEEFLPGR